MMKIHALFETLDGCRKWLVIDGPRMLGDLYHFPILPQAARIHAAEILEGPPLQIIWRTYELTEWRRNKDSDMEYSYWQETQ
jgi:hypothetical protein